MKKRFFVWLGLLLTLALLLQVGIYAAEVESEPTVDVTADADTANDGATGEAEELPAWQAVLEDILAYVVLGITAIFGIYTAFSPLLILLKKAANKFANATAGVLSTAETGDKQNTELKNLKAEFENYIKKAQEGQAASDKENAARAERTEKMLLTVMQMLTTVCCASPELVKSGVARTVANFKNRFTEPVPALKDARKENADNGKEA